MNLKCFDPINQAIKLYKVLFSFLIFNALNHKTLNYYLSVLWLYSVLYRSGRTCECPGKLPFTEQVGLRTHTIYSMNVDVVVRMWAIPLLVQGN